MYEMLVILSKLSFYKLLNAFKIWSSYLWARISRSIKICGLPYSLSIEPTTQCNLHCSECPSGQRHFTRPIGMMDFALYQTIINQAEKHLIYLLLYFQGEPYLHPAFFNMVKYAAKRKIFVATSTNAHYLSKANAEHTVQSGLNKLLISVDGITQEVYEQYRKGGSLAKVIEGIENLVEAKQKFRAKHPIIVLQFIVFKHNQHQINEFKTLAKTLGVDKYEIKSAQVYDFKTGNKLIPDLKQYSRYQKHKAEFKIKSQLPNRCWRMWHSVVITQSGQVAPCCFDKQAQHNYGVLSNAFSIKNAFYSNEANKFRKQVFANRSTYEMCRNCTEGLRTNY